MGQSSAVRQLFLRWARRLGHPAGCLLKARSHAGRDLHVTPMAILVEHRVCAVAESFAQAARKR